METENPRPLTRQELLITLYEEAFPSVASFIKKMGGNLEDAKDIFQDALIIFYEKVTEQQTVIQVDDRAYLTGICKHLWYKKFRQEKKVFQSQVLPELKRTEEQESILSDRILKLMEHSGKKCMELLQSFYFEKRSMKEIAQLFGFSGERSATAQKFKCLEKLRSTIKDNALNKEDFYE